MPVEFINFAIKNILLVKYKLTKDNFKQILKDILMSMDRK